MTDNLKTWPEQICLRIEYAGDHEGPNEVINFNSAEIIYWHEELLFRGDVKYVRADIAKEREAKLIRAAYHSCISLSDADCLENATALLYKRSKLEELK